MFCASCQIISGLEKILQNRVIPAHKPSPRRRIIWVEIFHFIKKCGRHFRGDGEGGQVGMICGGGGGGGSYDLVSDDHVFVCL